METAGFLSTLFFILLFIVFLAVYFLPAGIAAATKRENVFIVFLVNFFLGWSVIGWVAALVMAFWPNRRIQT